MTNDPNAERSDALARSANHLADLDARHDAHVAGLRERAERLRANAEADADVLEHALEPDGGEPHHQ